jgi:hypothetical protein
VCARAWPLAALGYRRAAAAHGHVLGKLLRDRRLCVSLRVAKRAICKFPKARAPGINRRGYEAALRIDVFIASGP